MSNNEEYIDELEYAHSPAEKNAMLGQGGQGVVLRTNNPDIAIKLIHGIASDDLEKKKALYDKFRKIQILPLPADIKISRPLALLKSHSGYVMRLLDEMVSINDKETISEKTPDWLKHSPKKSVADVLSYRNIGGLRKTLTRLSNCAGILSQLHGRGLVYGDLSPNNIFVSQDSDYDHVWLIDPDNLRFDQSSGGHIVYTPKYGAPELVRKEQSSPTSQTDCYSFSVIAFQLITLAHPFVGKDVSGWDSDEDGGEDKAYAGLLPWIDDPKDSSNSRSVGLPRNLTITSELEKLFSQTFCEGRLDPLARPSIFHWSSTLMRAADKAVKCTKCKMSWYYDTAGTACPYCKALRSRILVLKAYCITDDNEVEDLCWEYARELNPDESVIEIPNRVLDAFSTLENPYPKLQFKLNSKSVFISKSDHCDLNVHYAFSHRKEQKFHALNSKVEFKIKDLNTLCLYAGGMSRRILFCEIREAQNESSRG